MSFNSMFDLFQDEDEYPQNIAERGVPRNTLFSYVSNDFLNGLINYVSIKKAVLVERYEKDKGNYLEKIELFKKDYHSSFSMLDDDVLIAAETENSFWFFWYDQDCSDCMVGQFDKQKCTLGRYISLFDKMISTHHFLGKKSYPIYPRGWVRG